MKALSKIELYAKIQHYEDVIEAMLKEEREQYKEFLKYNGATSEITKSKLAKSLVLMELAEKLNINYNL